MIFVIVLTIFTLIFFFCSDTLSDSLLGFFTAFLVGLLFAVFLTIIFDLFVTGLGNWISDYKEPIIIEDTEDITIIQTDEKVIVTVGEEAFSYESDYVDIQIVDTKSPLTIETEIKNLKSKVLNWLHLPQNPTIEYYHIFAPGNIKFAYP